MESWDDENFEPPKVDTLPVLKSNRWVGEDEEEDVKESWEDEDEDKKDEEEEKKATEVKKPKKKTFEQRLAEKEAKKREELEKRLKQEEVEISPEERLRMQKESDLKLALETTFGVREEGEDEELGGLKMPATKEEFDEFTETLTKKLTPLSRHGNEFINFTEGLTRNLCAVMNSADIKKIKNTLDNLYLEKQKIEKGDKAKKNKGKGKAKLKLEGDNQLSAYTDYTNDFDEYEDFI